VFSLLFPSVPIILPPPPAPALLPVFPTTRRYILTPFKSSISNIDGVLSSSSSSSSGYGFCCWGSTISKFGNRFYRLQIDIHCYVIVILL
jgi:hypothetical protein